MPSPSSFVRQGQVLWDLLGGGVTHRRLLGATALILFAALLEGFGLSLLIPLIQSLGSSTSANALGTQFFRFIAGNETTSLLPAILCAVLAISILRSFTIRQRDLVLRTIRLDLLRRLRVRLYAAIAHAAWPFLRSQRSAEFNAALTAEIDRIDNTLFFAFESPARAATILANLVIAFLIAPYLTLLALATGLTTALALRHRILDSYRLGEALTAANERLLSEIVQFLQGIKAAKIFAAEDRQVSAFSDALHEMNRGLVAYARLAANARFVQEIIGSFAVIGFLYLGWRMAGLSLPELLVLALIFNRVLPLVQASQQSLQSMMHNAPAAAAVARLIDRCQAAHDSTSGTLRERATIQHHLTLRKISFSHGEDSSIATLNEVSMELLAGETTVLSGPSGAGKSTLVDLIAGLLPAASGELWLDNKPITQEAMPLWRASVAYVSQEPFLFNDSIRQNLLFANPSAEEGEILAAVKFAGLSEFVAALPSGLNTLAGDRGGRFSGGEKQRLALARALLRKPSLLILDEPTTSLDQASEQEIIESIASLRGSTTVLWVTHNPLRIAFAKRFYWLADGRLRDIS